MIIKKLQPLYKEIETKNEQGQTELLQVESGNQVVLKEISELIEFEQLAKPTKGVYKKRCIVYCESGPFVAPYSFEELLEMKRGSTPIGFKVTTNVKRKRTGRRNIPKPDEPKRTRILSRKLRDIQPETQENQSSEGLQ